MHLLEIDSQHEAQSPIIPAAAHIGHLIVFFVGEQAYGIAAGHVRQIVPIPALVRPPGSPPLLEGFMDLGGATIPVLRADGLFDRPKSKLDLYTPVLILNSSDGPLGLLVDWVQAVVPFSESHVVSLGEGSSFNDCADGLVEFGEHTVIVLDPKLLIARQQRLRLKELQDLARKQMAQWEETQP